MGLIGDLIVRARGLANDPCQSLGQPSVPNAVSSSFGIFNGTVYFVITYLTQWGESVGCAEFSVPNLNNNSVLLTQLAPPYAANAIRVYFGNASGQEFQYAQYPIAFNISGITVGTGSDVILSAAPPYKSSAWLPDTDGDLVDASEMYRWINAGLVDLGRRAGGFLDQTGAAPLAGSAEFNVPGYWLSFRAHWYNGWATIAQNQTYTWMQSPVQGIPGIITQWKNGANQVLGMWPQGNTNPATSPLTAPMSITDSIANVQSNGGFTAPGMCQIDNEIMSYSTGGGLSQPIGTTLGGIVRGFGGTRAAAHSAGRTVTQLIVRLLGYRLPALCVVGDSGYAFDMPQGWDSVLSLFIEGQYKRKENDVQAGQALIQQFQEGANALRDAQLPTEAKQIGGLYPFGGTAETLAQIMDTVIIN